MLSVTIFPQSLRSVFGLDDVMALDHEWTACYLKVAFELNQRGCLLSSWSRQT